MVQVCETDMDKTGNLKSLWVPRTSPESVEAQVYKKAEFETMYKLWSSFTGVQSFEFPVMARLNCMIKTGTSGFLRSLKTGS
jgi:hypothetical protein